MTDRESGAIRRPTLTDLAGDEPLAQLARTTWLNKTPQKVASNVVENELWGYVAGEEFSYFSLLLLEQLQALERYLWPGYNENASNHHVLLIALLANVKRQERLPVWSLLAERPDDFSTFFRRVLQLSIDSSLSTPVRTRILAFVVGAFQSLDNGLVRKECAPLVSIGIWHHLHSVVAREGRLSKTTQLQKAWRTLGKRFENADATGQSRLTFERSWLYTLLCDFLDKIYTVDIGADQKRENLIFSERFLELLCDLQSQLPTRRYVNTLLQDLNILPAIRLSALYNDGPAAAPLRDMCQLFCHYTYFPLDDQLGRPLSRQEHGQAQNARISQLQNKALKLHPEKLKILILANFGSVAQRSELSSHLDVLTDDELAELCTHLGLRTEYPEKSLVVRDRRFLMEAVVFHISRTTFYADEIQRGNPILPTEQVLYDSSMLRTDSYFPDSRPLAIPKLNLQYLSVGDFLWRSFTLYRAEAFFEIRKHVEDVIKRLQPRAGPPTRFDGFSRMAIPINRPAIVDILPPRVGEHVPAEVKAEIILDVSRLQPGVRREWESLRPGDIVYLLAVHPLDKDLKLTNGKCHQTEAETIGLKALRCAEIINTLDEDGKVMRQDRHGGAEFSRPRQRRMLLRLDAAAYSADKKSADNGKADVYESINLVVRRKARENNFKAVLQTVKQLIASDVAIPSWLNEVFLGFGDPSSAVYRRLATRLKRIDYRDTFLDWQHLVESLPGKILEPDEKIDASFAPPYVLESDLTHQPAPVLRPTKKRRRDQPNGPEASAVVEVVKVSTYTPPNTGPYPTDTPKMNAVRFTPAQIEAVSSGTQPGLTVIVGPPGTGKTDVATQIISNIYHNFPQQRTLLIAQSNQALNQLFQKIVGLNIDERHLLRLGHGEEELETEASFSKAGRVESFMARGARYLTDVQRLADSIGAVGAHGNSCETAEYFDQVWIQPRWKRYWADIQKVGSEDKDMVAAKFPFQAFFVDAPGPLFSPTAEKADLVETARGCERHMRRMFDELAEIRPFEILRRERDKANYLLVNEARIVAMTSTHAAIRRQEIASLGFHYDNVIMEEAAQVTEIENFIPFMLQKPSTPDGQRSESQLQRIVLVGDHLQNSPVIQNAAFRSYANLEQSFFQRLIRLGVPHILLDAQGRSRPSLAKLYQWRYPRLTNLPFTSSAPEFLRANAGLRYDVQFIEVADYKGKGETEPSPHFIQNLGEAEYAVALYQYMRLHGYPAAKISILCTYAGQRALIRDVLAHRCKGNRFFGMPAWVGTVDKYQGEQNDYVILSLVRTKAPGYLRDVRRLTVALSRARLGLYVLGREEVFQSSLELREAFAELLSRGPSEHKLAIVPGETFPTERGVGDEAESTEMEGVEHLGQYVFEITQARMEQSAGMSLAATTGANVEELGDGRRVIEADEDDEEER